MRHLIIEGPDGGGKTRLIEALQRRFPGLSKGPRASTSLGGPVPDLAEWVTAQNKYMDSCTTPLIYDRHPVISEPIYGTIVRGRPKPGFDPGPYLSTMRLSLYEKCFVIFCLPSLAQCQSAVDKERDMPGVAENIDEIYAAYMRRMNLWGGPNIRYNFSISSKRGVTDDGLFEGAVEFANDYSSLIVHQVFGSDWLGGTRVA